MIDEKHVETLGRLTAIDLFLGNRDRAYAGNLGNWIYDPGSSAITAIDHVDPSADSYMKKDQQDAQDTKLFMAPLAKSQLKATARDTIDAIAQGAGTWSGDSDFAAWLDDGSGARRRLAADAMERGLAEGRRLVIKTFSATRFAGSSKSRKVKKAIKKSSRAANATDSDRDNSSDYADYYSVLKARAQVLSTT